uniref:Uncharacterized protein n=1 Tax=Arundo donax TaxID=35708 RepID=A0A0A8YJ59_ARUDO
MVHWTCLLAMHWPTCMRRAVGWMRLVVYLIGCANRMWHHGTL